METKKNSLGITFDKEGEKVVENTEEQEEMEDGYPIGMFDR